MRGRDRRPSPSCALRTTGGLLTRDRRLAAPRFPGLEDHQLLVGKILEDLPLPLLGRALGRAWAVASGLVPAEVDGFVGWALHTLGRAPQPEDVRDLVAESGSTVPDDDFVEDTAAHLIQLLGLPLPPALQEVTG